MSMCVLSNLSRRVLRNRNLSRVLDSQSRNIVLIVPLIFRATQSPRGCSLLVVSSCIYPTKRGKRVPVAQVSLASIATVLQRGGGSQSFPAALLDTALDDMAAVIESRTLPQVTQMSFECLGEDAPTLFAMLSDLVRYVFPNVEPPYTFHVIMHFSF
jgi:hypothetical protein